MVEIDLSKLTPNVAEVLRLRGTNLPPLIWSDHALPQANALLEELPDDKLFSTPQVTDAGLATGVRALLYLRSGWSAEALMYAMMASEDLREYICGMGERGLGHADRAKNHFQKIIDHDVFGVLSKLTQGLLKNSMDKRLTRLAGILEVHGNWEPYAFIDVFEEARTGQMSSASEHTVRVIQSTEFNLLFLHSYQQLMKVDAKKVEEEQAERHAAPRKRISSKKHRPPSSPTPSRSAPASKEPPPAPKPVSKDVRVGCPKCKNLKIYPASQRGEKTRCEKCQVVFAIPGGKTAASTGPSTSVRVACPKCRMAGSYPVSKRGCKVQCAKCSAHFNIPKRSAA